MKIAKKSIRNFSIALRSRFSFSWNLYHPLPDQQLNPVRQALVSTHLSFEDHSTQNRYQKLLPLSLSVLSLYLLPLTAIHLLSYNFFKLVPIQGFFFN